MLVLGLAICAAGFLASLLPALPEGLQYWVLLLTISVLYPLILVKTFRANRVDYEFRLLHWFPTGIFVLWISMQILASRFSFMHILNLGFNFLWSLPFVLLGIIFIIIFALHVIRRRTVRIVSLSIIMALFLAGAVSAEGFGWNDRLQDAIFSDENPAFAVMQNVYLSGKRYLARISSVPVDADATWSSSEHVVTTMTSSSAVSNNSSATFSSLSSFSVASSKASLPPVIGSIKPDNLASSGPPEMIALLAVTMGALYFGLLHRRAEKRA